MISQFPLLRLGKEIPPPLPHVNSSNSDICWMPHNSARLTGSHSVWHFQRTRPRCSKLPNKVYLLYFKMKYSRIRRFYDYVIDSECLIFIIAKSSFCLQQGHLRWKLKIKPEFLLAPFTSFAKGFEQWQEEIWKHYILDTFPHFCSVSHFTPEMALIQRK